MDAEVGIYFTMNGPTLLQKGVPETLIVPKKGGGGRELIARNGLSIGRFDGSEVVPLAGIVTWLIKASASGPAWCRSAGSRPMPNASCRAWKLCSPVAASIETFLMRCGVSAATFSISTPPSVEAMNTTR